MKNKLLHILRIDYPALNTDQNFKAYIESILDFYDQKKDVTKQKLIALFSHYNYQNRLNFINPKAYPHLSNIYPHIMLNKEPGQHEIQIFLDYDGGIGKGADEYFKLIEDPEIYPESLDEFDGIYDIHDHILTTWLSLLWQEINGASYGVIIKYDAQGMSYFLNDQQWDDESAFQFQHKIKNYSFDYEKHSLEEIYRKVTKK